VRFVVAVLMLGVTTHFASGQDQDRKLLDRVLKPDMELKNNAQDKAFHASGVTDNKKATTNTFQFEDKNQSKTFNGTQSFFARLFHSKPFYHGDHNSFLDAKKSVDAPAFASVKAVSTHPSQATGRQVNGGSFAGSTREFRDQGKSPKSLDQKNRPMTIDEVRELLNKNK
jgi:hypothetical protein